MNKTYFQMSRELGAAVRQFEVALEKNWPAVKEVLVAGKQVLKMVAQVSSIKANISITKEALKNGFAATVNSGMNGSFAGYNSVDGMH